jgi:glyoxylase-like metal-dependent hydrolase (beta-lactamase superfamily II)
MYGFPKYEESEADKFISEQDIIKFGNTEMSILFLPGHSPGHLAFVHQESKSIFSGDVLFFRSIGRTDLPGGHHQTLLNSIQNNLFSLSDDYIVYPGHGKPTKLGEEKKLNPYLN